MKSRQLIDNWEQFKQKYEKAINSKKARLNITLYGSYYPAQETKLLMELGIIDMSWISQNHTSER
ncbi:MAG: hypothetical protein WA323_29250 [Candidatus Nitrosopolaris sp.]